MVHNVVSVDEQLEIDTIWLAKKLSGPLSQIGSNLTIDESNPNYMEPTKIIIMFHESLPQNSRIIKPFRMEKSSFFVVQRGRKRNETGRTKNLPCFKNIWSKMR